VLPCVSVVVQTPLITGAGPSSAVAVSVDVMEAAQPPEEPAGELPTVTDRYSASQTTFGGWEALRNLIWGTPQFMRLWLAQLVTSTGEWVFFLAVAIKAAEVGPGTPEGAVALVLLARLGPGFFFGQLAGVLADRWDRRKLMALCDVARAGVVCAFPFVSHVWQLVLLSLVLEAFTLLWIPAKEALVPNLLPAKHLPTANTLSVLATYGTFPLAIFLMWVFETQSNDGTVAGFFFDSGTFVVSAILIWSIVVPKRAERDAEPTSISANKLELKSIFTEIRLGWKLIFGDPTLRAVNFGLAVGLVGGAMLATLGRVYLDEVLLEVDSSFALLWGFGVGVVVGVLTLLVVSQRIDRPWVFGRALLLAGLALLLATSIDVTGIVVVLLGLTGAAVGVVYILGFTIIQETTDDEMRGRVFAAFYSVARVGVLLIVVAAPALTVLFDRITELTADGTVNVFGHRLLIPGVRITFWLAALIIVGAGTFAIRTLRGVTTGDPDPGLRAVN
jgi:dTMP kinase